MRTIENRKRKLTPGLALGLFLALGGLVATLAVAAETDSARLDRQVRVMTLVIDEHMGPQSHGMFHPGGATRGLALEELGALFIVAPLPEHELLQYQSTKVGFKIRDPEHTSDKEDEAIRAELQGKWEQLEQWREESERLQKECLADIRSKLIDVMLDYGPTLTALRDDQWVVVAAYPQCVMALPQRDAGTLLLKVRMRDLRQFDAGGLSREAAIDKIKIDER